MSKVRMGLVGCGKWGEVHAEVYATHPYAALTAVCDVNAEKAKQLADKYKVLSYTDLNKMLTDESLDAVAVVTPDFAHTGPVVAACQAGCHVIVEKPLATTKEDCKKIVAAARENKVQVMVDYHNRWNPPVCKIKDELESGKPGRVIHAYCRLSDRIFVPTEMLPWSAKSSILWFLGSHSVDTLGWLIGSRVRRVFAVSRKDVLPRRGIDVADVYQTTLEYEDGTIAQIENSWILPNANCHVNDYKLNLTCEHAAFSMDYSHNRLIERVYDDWADRPDMLCFTRVQGKGSGLGYESIRDFVERIYHREKVRVPLEEAVDVTRVILAVIASADKGQPVLVEDIWKR